jgi:hypothetical protein
MWLFQDFLDQSKQLNQTPSRSLPAYHPSAARSGSKLPFPARLACVKPAASVQSEP